MNKPFKILAVLAALTVVLFAGLAIFVGAIDANKYRPQLVDALTRQTGREVKLDGPIAFSLGLGGLRVSIQNASIANASWGSRPVMAGMGKFDLVVGVLPLLRHRVSVHKLSIENADILLESNAAGQHNWDFGGSAGSGAKQAPPPSSSSPSAPLSNASLNIDDLSIVNSQLSLRSADGKVTSLNVASLDLTMRESGAEVKFAGDADGAPITIDVKTSITNLLSQDKFSFDADATYNAFHLMARGEADIGAGSAKVSDYRLTVKGTAISGDVAVTWSGPRPTIRGALNSDHIDLADFKPTSSAEVEDTAPANVDTRHAASSGNKRIFSDAPLPSAALRSADASLDVSVRELLLGNGALKNVSARLVLNGGNLALAPAKAVIGSSPVDLQARLDASQSPARLTAGIIGNGIDLSDLQKLGGMSPFMSGDASANIQLTGQGNSLHEIASSLGGIIVITANKGQILTGAASKISSSLAAVFSPVGSNDALNCLAARFIAKNGVLADNGILIDSAASTVAGSGKVNLDSETVDLTLHARTKLVDIGGLVPALHIGGGLSNPHYSVDAASVVHNVVGALVNGNVNVVASGVPDMQIPLAGQNACLYTLDHPTAPNASSGVLSTNPVTNATQNIKNMGKTLLKGLFGQ